VLWWGVVGLLLVCRGGGIEDFRGEDVGVNGYFSWLLLERAVSYMTSRPITRRLGQTSDLGSSRFINGKKVQCYMMPVETRTM